MYELMYVCVCGVNWECRSGAGGYLALTSSSLSESFYKCRPWLLGLGAGLQNSFRHMFCCAHTYTHTHTHTIATCVLLLFSSLYLFNFLMAWFIHCIFTQLQLNEFMNLINFFFCFVYICIYTFIHVNMCIYTPAHKAIAFVLFEINFCILLFNLEFLCMQIFEIFAFLAKLLNIYTQT